MLAQSDPAHARLQRFYPLIVVPLLLFVGGLSARHLDSDGIWLGEWWSRYSAGAPEFGEPLSLSGIWARHSTEDTTSPPGFLW